MGLQVRTFKNEKVFPIGRSVNGEVEKSITVNNYFIYRITIMTRGTGSKNYNEGVLNYAVNMSSTVHYVTKKVGNTNMVKLTSASGGVRNIDSGFQITNQNMIMVTFGSYNGRPFKNQRIVHNTSKRTWSYKAPSWNYVGAQATKDVGISIHVTVTRGRATYKANVQYKY